MHTVKVVAPAKVNLFLGIGQRRADGYHDLTTVFHALAMHDTLTLTLVPAGEDTVLFEPGDAAQPMRQVEAKVAPGSGLQVGARVLWTAGLDPVDIPDEHNLACKAVHALAAVLGREEDELVRIVVEKRIPQQAGLGGGSADAAAALVGAAKLWGIAPDDARIEEVARKLGADVAFFLHGGCVFMEGTGDVFGHRLTAAKDTLVLVKPEGGVSTAAAYARFDEAPPLIPEDLLARAQQAKAAQQVPLFNNLADAAESLQPVLAEVRSFLADQPGVTGVLLSGSGSSTFALCKDYAAGQALSAAAQARGWWARCTALSSLSASVLG